MLPINHSHVMPTELSFSKLTLQQLQVVRDCEIAQLLIFKAEGMLQSGFLGGACNAGFLLVGEAIDALVHKYSTTHWSDRAFRLRLERLEALVGSQDFRFIQALELMSLPETLTKQTAQEYVERCVDFALNGARIAELDVPSASHFSADNREPRYRFNRMWGSVVLDLGMATKKQTESIRATISGGRGQSGTSQS